MLMLLLVCVSHPLKTASLSCQRLITIYAIHEMPAVIQKLLRVSLKVSGMSTLCVLEFSSDCRRSVVDESSTACTAASAEEEADVRMALVEDKVDNEYTARSDEQKACAQRICLPPVANDSD